MPKNASHDDLRHLTYVNERVTEALAAVGPLDFSDNVALVQKIYALNNALAHLQGYTQAGIDWGKQEQEPWPEIGCEECGSTESDLLINDLCPDCYAVDAANRSSHGCGCHCNACMS